MRSPICNIVVVLILILLLVYVYFKAMKTRMLSETQRRVIVGLLTSGMSIHHITATLGMAQSIVFTILKNFHDRETLQPLKSTNRPLKFN